MKEQSVMQAHPSLDFCSLLCCTPGKCFVELSFNELTFIELTFESTRVTF